MVKVSVIVKLFIEFVLFIYSCLQVFHHTVIQLGLKIICPVVVVYLAARMIKNNSFCDHPSSFLYDTVCVVTTLSYLDAFFGTKKAYRDEKVVTIQTTVWWCK